MSKKLGETIDRLREMSADERLRKGDRLATLAELSDRLGVSRTVVREAVASLSADGVLVSRHGVGVFVAAPAQPESLEPIERFSAPFMDVLELRMAFEVHAAGLAANRRSWAQEAAIWKAALGFEGAMDNDDLLDSFDIDFHRAIALATNNQAFAEFFELMSNSMMPQPAFSRQLNPTLITEEYIRQSAVEHRTIAEAITAGSVTGAQDAMRHHLQRGHRRYTG